jgi:hypothetical protein
MATRTEYVPAQAVQSVSVGYVTAGLSNPTLFLVVGGVAYGTGVRVTYTDAAFRYYFPTYNQSTGEVRLYCHVVTYKYDIPAQTVGPVEVYIAN